MKSGGGSGGQVPAWFPGLGRAAPWALGVWAVLSVAARFAPADWFGMNPVQAALRGPAPHASFAPDFSGRSSNPVGDAVREANLAPTEFRAPIRFSTDAHGFRDNPFLAPGAAPEYLILGGASYTYGANLSDDETIAAQLTLASGTPSYALSRYHRDASVTPADAALITNAFGTPPRVGILVILEPGTPGPPEEESRDGRKRKALMRRVIPGGSAGAKLARTVRELGREMQHFWAFSPVDVLAVRARKRLSDDRILPNEYRLATDTLSLPAGRMVVRQYELAAASARRPPDAVQRAAAYVEWWRHELGRQGIRLHVLLVPMRYTVYGEIAETGQALERLRQGVGYLEGLTVELEERDIPVTNALEVFRAHRAEELRSGELSFYREDHHWTPAGVRRVAEALADDIARRHPGAGAD